VSYVTYANSDLTPRARRKLARLVLKEGRTLRPGRGTPDQGTELPVRKPAPQRYEHDHPGDLIHVDNKLGRITNGGEHRALGRAKGRRSRRKGTGYTYLHHTVDDHSRLAYSEILNDETREPAAAS
jgi:hypothetical protein